MPCSWQCRLAGFPHATSSDFNYYHYQPGLNIIIVYCKHITHAHTHAHTRALAHTHLPAHHHRRSGCRCSMGRCAQPHDKVNTPFSPVPLAMNCRSVLHSSTQSRMRRGIRDSFGCFSRIKKCLGRSETRTRDRICFQSIRTVWDIYRDDWAIIATCSLWTPTDWFKEDYSIDGPEKIWSELKYYPAK